MVKNQYAMTEQQIEALAQERTASLTVTEAFDGTYLKVLITAGQAKLGPKKGKRPTTETQLSALDAAAQPYYAAVLRGVTTDDIVLRPELEAAEATRRTRERNRRATFARTAKSTIFSWIREGGDLRAVDVSTVTKSEMRASIVAARAEQGVPAASRVERAQQTILAAVANDPPERARERLYAVIHALQDALDALPDGHEERHHESTVIRTRVGMPTFREPARVLNRGA